MTGLGVIIGSLILAASIDRFADNLCSMLKKIDVNFGTIRVRPAETGEDGKS